MHNPMENISLIAQVEAYNRSMSTYEVTHNMNPILNTALLIVQLFFRINHASFCMNLATFLQPELLASNPMNFPPSAFHPESQISVHFWTPRCQSTGCHSALLSRIAGMKSRDRHRA